MTSKRHITKAEERNFYREAVRASLQEFYGKSDAESRKLVSNWWKRLSTTKAFESGLFMHSEPINTAAGIAGVEVVPITSKNRENYHRILGKSWNLLRANPRRAHKNLKSENFVVSETLEISAPKLSKEEIIREIAKMMNISLKESKEHFDLLGGVIVNRAKTDWLVEFYIPHISQLLKAESEASAIARQNASEIIKRAKAVTQTGRAKKKGAKKQARVAVG